MAVKASAYSLFVNGIDSIFAAPDTVRFTQIRAFLQGLPSGADIRSFEVVKGDLPAVASATYRGAEASPSNAELYETLDLKEQNELTDYFLESLKKAFVEFPDLKKQFPKFQI
jgi:hypothetical protein